MLSIHEINNIDYYVDEDYYQTEDQPEGIWIGKGAIALGISSNFIGAEYHSIMNGLALDGKTPLCAIPGETHQPGWDLTFSAPKSVSIVWAAADQSLREKISEAQLVAVKRAVSFLEKHAAFTRRGQGGQLREPIDGLVVATFEHETSRELDPQLHTHALVANVAPRSDGTWGTIVSRDLYLWQKTAGTIYRAELAYQLNQLSFAVESEGAEFRLGCVPQDVNMYFSKRANAIKELLGQTSARSSASSIGDKIKLISRQNKQKTDRSELLERWQLELHDFGINAKFIEAHRNHRLLVKPDFELNSEGVLLALTEKTAVFRAQDLYQFIAERLQCLCISAIDIQNFAASVINDDELVPLGLDYRYSQLFTTKQMLRLESEVVELASDLFSSSEHKLSNKDVMNAIYIKEQNCGYVLSQEQRIALIETCCNGDLSIMQGSAGAGKSSAMDVLRRAYKSNGRVVIGAAIAKKAADNLQEETGIKSFTVAKLISDFDRGHNHFAKISVLVVDEAGQVGTRQLHQLLTIAIENNVKIVLVGEDKQLDAIEHGGCLRYLSRILDCSRIETIKRQRENWAREAVMHIRDGKAYTALETFHKKGLLNFFNTAEDTKQAMVQAWNKFRLSNVNKSTLLLAQKWEDVNKLSAQVRKILQTEGSVSTDEIEIECIISEHQCTYKFAQGDRIKFCKNDYRLGISNGAFGIIKTIKHYNGDIIFNIQIDDGSNVTISKKNYQNENGRLPIALGYALTVYASQGTTIDGDVFIYWTNGMDRANSYVAGSRHKDNCHWFFNNQDIDLMAKSEGKLNGSISERIKIIAKTMSFDRRKIMAIEHLDNLNKKEIKYELLKSKIEIFE